MHADNSNVDFNPVFENDKSYSITEEENDHTNVSDGLLPAVDEYGVSPAAFKFLMTLTASNSIPLSTTNFVKNSAKELVQDILTYLEFRTLQVLKKAGVDTDPDSIQLMHEFNGWKDPNYIPIATTIQMVM